MTQCALEFQSETRFAQIQMYYNLGMSNTQFQIALKTKVWIRQKIRQPNTLQI